MSGRENELSVVTWWQGDPPPDLPRPVGFSVRRDCDDAELALLQGSFEGVVAARRGAGNVAFVARLRGRPLAYAWVALKCGHIGPLGLSFPIDKDDLYVWDLTILDAGRPLAAGSHLLRAIVERSRGSRAWMALPCERAHEAEAAGLTEVARLYRDEGEARIEATGDPLRAIEAARLFGLPEPKGARQPATAA